MDGELDEAHVRVRISELLVAGAACSALLCPLLLNCSAGSAKWAVASNLNKAVATRAHSCLGWPSLLETPAWLASEFSHMMYYSNFTGADIRLLVSRTGVSGPWQEMDAPVLTLTGQQLVSAFVTHDDRHQRLQLFYTTSSCSSTPSYIGAATCARCTRVAESRDGLNFEIASTSPPPSSPTACATRPIPFALPSAQQHEPDERFDFAWVERAGHGLALAQRRADVEEPFVEVPGPVLLPRASHATVIVDPSLPCALVVWSSPGYDHHDSTQRPTERILFAPLVASALPHRHVALGEAVEILGPTTLAASSAARGGVREPSVLRVRAGEWLLAYTADGGSAFGLARLQAERVQPRADAESARGVHSQRTNHTESRVPLVASAVAAAPPLLVVDAAEWAPPPLLPPSLQRLTPARAAAHAAVAARGAPLANSTPAADRNSGSGGRGDSSAGFAVVGANAACDCLVRSRRFAPECGQAGESGGPPRRLLITGTGRSGTTFLRRALGIAGAAVDHDRDTRLRPLSEIGAVSWPQAFAASRRCPYPTWTWRRRLAAAATSSPAHGRRRQHHQGQRRRSRRPHDVRRFELLIAIVRSPRKSIESRYSDGAFNEWRAADGAFASCLTDAGGFAYPRLPSGAPADAKALSLRFTLRHWVLWHAFVEATAHARLRVEDVDARLVLELGRLAAVPQRLLRGVADVRVRLRDLGSNVNHNHTKHSTVTWPMLRACDPLFYGMALLMALRYGYVHELPPDAASEAAALNAVAHQRCGFDTRGVWACWLSPRRRAVGDAGT